MSITAAPSAPALRRVLGRWDLTAIGVNQVIGGASVLIVRTDEGLLKAHHNVCRHRGTRLCDDAEGHFVERIQCPYHNWTYDLAGSLLAAPHMAPGFCKEDYPLHRAGCEVWDGNVFVYLGQGLSQPADAGQLFFNGAAAVFYGIWPAVIAATAFFIRRRQT